MLKEKKKFISKILLVSMCASIVPATVALAGENVVTQENVTKEIAPPRDNQLQATTSISLKSNASTGYSWKYSVVQGDSIGDASTSYVPDDTSGEIVGSGGTDIWTFKGLKEGSTTLKFEYSRSWEKAVADTKEFIVTVDSSMNITVKETNKGTAQIQLKSNASTGYQWRYSIVQGDSIAEDSKVYVTDAVLPDIVGSGGSDIWVFKGLKEGSTLLKFEYLRPWEKNVAETKYFNLTVDKNLNVVVTEGAQPLKTNPSCQRSYDLNGDGKVNAIDFAVLRKYLSDNTVHINKDAADINLDGKINAIDLALLRKIILS